MCFGRTRSVSDASLCQLRAWASRRGRHPGKIGAAAVHAGQERQVRAWSARRIKQIGSRPAPRRTKHGKSRSVL